MTINGARPCALPTAMGGPALTHTGLPGAARPPSPHLDSWSESRYTATPQEEPKGEAPKRPLLPRGASPGLRRHALHSPPVARASFSQPGAHSTDSQLAAGLEKSFGILHPFLKDGRLTQSSLRQLATAQPGESDELDRAIDTAKEIIKRPRLNDAIVSGNGDITRDSLSAAANALMGNSAPNAFSQDPFHAQGNAQVVTAFQDLFEQLRDPAKDRTFFFEKHQYVEITGLRTLMSDPNALDAHGQSVLDPGTGLPAKRYSEHTVYTAKNILERPGLVRSLERASGMRVFGPAHQEGWISNKGVERWLEQDKVHKAR